MANIKSLIALHVWAATSSYEALGDFGWLYSTNPRTWRKMVPLTVQSDGRW
jgi:hypothetical protein